MLKTTDTTAREAIEFARAADKSMQTPYPRLCLRFVRKCWGLPAVYGTAKEAWQKAEVKHKYTGDTEDIPWGAPVFSRPPNAPKDDPWHVFICGGHDKKGKRIFRSTDILTRGGVDVIHITAITEKWGQEILGWSEDLNGYKLNLPKSPNQRKAARRRKRS